MTQDTERKSLAFLRSMGEEKPTFDKCAEVVTTDGSGALHVVPVSAKQLLTLMKTATEILAQKGVLHNAED